LMMRSSESVWLKKPLVMEAAFNNWWMESDFQPSASFRLIPPTSFVAESKQCERNRNSSGEAANTPAM
ncbi:hypothetical protein Ancab_004679, partial [Ancistrocladus abbreviatus]